jgi:tetratricopeptide (TPR) repeat protein
MSLKQAESYKNKGNKFFNRGKYDKAISYYNLAIDTCPKENSEKLAIFYQNRAAAYEKLVITYLCACLCYLYCLYNFFDKTIFVYSKSSMQFVMTVRKH